MKRASLFVLLSSFWTGGLADSSTASTRPTPEGGRPQQEMTPVFIPLNKTHGLPMPPAADVISPTAPEASTTKESLLSKPLSSEVSAPPGLERKETLTSKEKTEEGMIRSQKIVLPTNPGLKISPGAESVVLSNSTLKFLRSFARPSNQQESSRESGGEMGNRSPRETFLSRGGTPGSQRAKSEKAAFETTRGKNWCAYVHTRLSPTVILDTQVSHVPERRGTCGWYQGFCPQRSQKISNPVYRMQHKIVTSLDWKCCPGFSGPNCQLKAPEQQPLIHSPQDESHTAVDNRTTAQQQQQQPDCADPAVMQKVTEQMNNQAMKLTLLQKKIDNISLAVNDVQSTYTSLEGKISEDKGREFQSFLKGLKSKSINELVKGLVKEQFKSFQNEMQETVAQVFKTVSSLSEGLEDTRQLIRQVNESVVSIAIQQKSVLIQENIPTLTDLLNLKNNIVNVRQAMASTCEKPIKELETKQAQLEGALEQEHSRTLLYYETLNQTFSKMKEVHKQLLSEKPVSVQKNVPDSNDGTEHMSTLQENIKKQGLMMLRMFDDLNIQNNKIHNLTISLEKEKASVRGKCEDLFSKCRKDFMLQMKGTAENVHVLNQTLADVLFPMDTRMNKMSEQLNDLTYDMEILQPLLEQGASLKQTVKYEQSKEAVATREKVDYLASAVDNLKFLIRELTKKHSSLRSETQHRGDALETRLNDYTLAAEDGLNKTMTIINNAIDFIQDNYVLKNTLSTIKYNPQVHHECSQKMDTILSFIPQLQRLNKSIALLVNDNQRYNFVLQVAKALADIPEDEKLSHASVQKIYQMLNETTSKMMKYQEHMSLLEEKILYITNTSRNYETRFQGIESKVTQALIPYYITLQNGQVDTNGRDQALQLQVLNSRFKALEAKSIHLSINFSLLNKTLHETVMKCHNASTSISEVNATLPKRIKAFLPDMQLLQKGLTEFVESIIEIKTRAALSNLTWYIDQSLSGSLANILKSQKQVKSLLKKPNTFKKPTVNVTTYLVGRAQRNIDNIIYPGKLFSDNRPLPVMRSVTRKDGSSSTAQDASRQRNFSKGSYRYAPMVAFFASHTHGMTTAGPILFNNLDVNYGASYTPSTGKFRIPYLGVYVFKYTIESFSAHVSGFLVVDGVDKLTFESENVNSEVHCDRVLTGDALLELNFGQEVWLRLVKGTIPVKFPPVTTFSGYLLYRT
ncbi:multimerin-1 [Echinops telfairi]|uniref:Multimerin-1 n=1 Tax=Echinops telfairi TaxID=9371 RepID=A0AC55CJ71_ECHTE|nr:multimerin-1 [Echinops telfairi]